LPVAFVGTSKDMAFGLPSSTYPYSLYPFSQSVGITLGAPFGFRLPPVAVIPAAFYSSLSIDREASTDEENEHNKSVLAISRGTSVILLFVYASYRKCHSIFPSWVL
jgi:hypothetical protein